MLAAGARCVQAASKEEGRRVSRRPVNPSRESISYWDLDRDSDRGSRFVSCRCSTSSASIRFVTTSPCWMTLHSTSPPVARVVHGCGARAVLSNRNARRIVGNHAGGYVPCTSPHGCGRHRARPT